jgi:hypothetical protein
MGAEGDGMKLRWPETDAELIGFFFAMVIFVSAVTSALTALILK